MNTTNCCPFKHIAQCFSHSNYSVPFSSLVFCREAGSWLPYSPLFPVFFMSLYFFHKLLHHTQSFPPPWSFSYLTSHILGKSREVVSRCLPPGVFTETPSPF